MNEHRMKILEMLAAGKVTAAEADRLINALDKEPAALPAGSAEPGSKPKPKYLRVVVEDHSKNGDPVQVNVRVPMQLLRAGVKLAGLIPQQARVQVNDALREKGMQVDLSSLKPENLEELVNHLDELTVAVDDKDKTKVRVFCE